ncbi:MAG: response regulator [candidate division Zixibacteria bacterium]|nr:response regulator [candidate division Zixibacteria bacterium]
MPHNILLVDDEFTVRELIGNLLMMLGYPYFAAPDAKTALEALNRERFSIMITDIHMPAMSGVELVERTKKIDPDIGVIVVTGVGDLKIAIGVMKQGANEYLLNPLQFEALHVSIIKCLERRSLQMEVRSYQAELEKKVTQRTDQLMSALSALHVAHQDVRQAYVDLVTVLAKAAESNDNDTGNHIRLVSAYVTAIARQLGVAPDECERIAQFSTTHDIGKVTIHPDILKKPGKLTDDEYEAMKLHTVNGSEILGQSPLLHLAADIALSHHERYDGKGYPHRIGGTEIPMAARITSIADVFDALTIKRCYKEAWPIERARAIILDERGKQFDPEVVDAFNGCFGDIEGIRNRFPE